MAPEKTPLHSVVSVICDALEELPLDDRRRAIEAACIALGLAREPTRSNTNAGGLSLALPPAVVEESLLGVRSRGVPDGGTFRNGRGSLVSVLPLPRNGDPRAVPQRPYIHRVR